MSSRTDRTRAGMPARRRARLGFTLIELLVVIAIIALLVSILVPSLKQAKELARTVACRSNMHGLAMATIVYTHDWEGYFPHGTRWNTMPEGLKTHRRWIDFIDEESGTELRTCPGSANFGFRRSTGEFVLDPRGPEKHRIAPNGNMCTRDDYWVPGPIPSPSSAPHARIDDFERHGMLMIVIDNGGDRYAGGWHPGEWLRWRHQNGEAINVGFLDGHAETWNRDEVMGIYESGQRDNPKDLIVDGLGKYPWGEALVRW